jgi:DnaB-like helicase C terminal domain/Toprim domain
VQAIPEELQNSRALQYIISKGLEWRPRNDGIELEKCLICGRDGWKFYMACVEGRDGLYKCVACDKGGNLDMIKEKLGDKIRGVESRREWSGSQEDVEALPDIDKCHQAMLEDDEGMDYLMNGRGFSREIIERQKIGLVPDRAFKETGKVRAIVYPYLVNGNCVFVHYRTLPDMDNLGKIPKAFNSPRGWDVPLYNGEVLKEGLKEVVMVEGEANCIAAMDHGIENICGVPGANVKKAAWIDTLDKLELEKIYICYDNDSVGQKAAQVVASRIGVEHCWKITLPTFSVTTDDGKVRNGKDLNEWFAVGGGTSDGFEQLRSEAVLFDVDGVASSKDAVQEFLDELEGKGTVEPTYKPPWASLAKLVGFDPGDVIDVLAPEKIGKTTFGMNLMEAMVDRYGEDGIIICLEMTRAKLARKWICHKAQIADNIPGNPEDARKLTNEFLHVIPGLQMMAAERQGDLYFCYPKYKGMDDLYKLMRDCIRRYGVKWIMFDNLQRACDTTLGSKNRTQHLSEISKVLSQIAKDYNVQIVRILQPHRIADGRMVNTDNVDGSSQVAKDCDCMITLHRNRVGQVSAEQFETCMYVQNDATFDEKMLTTVGLSRYSGGGYTTLQYDGAKSTVNEFSAGQIVKLIETVNKNVGYKTYAPFATTDVLNEANAPEVVVP